MSDVIRRVRFAPYRAGAGPRFALTVWATSRTDSRGQTKLRYRLTQCDGRKRSVVFEGADFAGSPLHADDSDDTVESLMGFLTLRQGDTDSDYFANYSEAQLAFAIEHAEALSSAVYSRFGSL